MPQTKRVTKKGSLIWLTALVQGQRAAFGDGFLDVKALKQLRASHDKTKYGKRSSPIGLYSRSILETTSASINL